MEVTRKRLALIVGAGASYDCIPNGLADATAYRPPLVSNLFAGNQIAITLAEYPQAETIMNRVRTRITSATQMLESELKDLTLSQNRYIKEQLNFVPLAFHDFFRDCSDNYGRPINYHALLNGIFNRNLHLGIISLNYDTLIDSALATITSTPLDSIGSYIQATDWLLAKPHGSINWGYPWPGLSLHPRSESHIEPPPIDRAAILVEEDDLAANGNWLYPALVLPVEGKYGFICPEDHEAALGRFLAACDSFLFVGFSARDTDVLEIIRDRAQPPKHVGIATWKDGAEIQARLAAAIPSFGPADSVEYRIYEQGFTAFLERELDLFLDSLG